MELGKLGGEIATSFDVGLVKYENQKRGEQKGIVTTQDAIEQLGKLYVHSSEYTYDMAKQECPYLHYSSAGNIFQMLRFGIQSKNFKKRLVPLRANNPNVEDLAEQMCGFRIQQGGGYQSRDSISLSTYSEDYHTPPGNILYLIDSEIRTEGHADRNTASGYGQGIDPILVAGEYEVGNPTAYKNEVLGVNIILPENIRAIMVDRFTSILQEMTMSIHQMVLTFFQEKNKDPEAGENLVATLLLLARLMRNKDRESEVHFLKQEAVTLRREELTSRLIALQKKLLSEFVGTENKLNEENLRRALKDVFGICILQK